MENLPSVENFCCLNETCADRLLFGCGNLSFRGWSGKSKKIRMLYCNTCKSHVSERKGSPLEKSRISPEKVCSIMELLKKGKGTRATSRIVKVHRDTVTRYSRILKANMIIEQKKATEDSLHIAAEPTPVHIPSSFSSPYAPMSKDSAEQSRAMDS